MFLLAIVIFALGLINDMHVAKERFASAALIRGSTRNLRADIFARRAALRGYVLTLGGVSMAKLRAATEAAGSVVTTIEGLPDSLGSTNISNLNALARKKLAAIEARPRVHTTRGPRAAKRFSGVSASE